MKKTVSLALSIAALIGCSNTSQTQSPAPQLTQTNTNAIEMISIPKPADMVANVTTNGRTSTVIQVDVASVGQQIPFTYSHGKVANTPGFSWYVSKHFALKTDFPAERAAFFLRLLELSYPYYVEFFAMEPPNIANQRIASTYATSNDKLRLAMFDDGFNRGIHDYAGGEAMYYNWVGYSFPTERPQHQRYIAIHETMHSYQMALGNYPWTPSWHGEGLGDSVANHIYDSEKQQLTVFGHDVPIFDMVSWSLDTYNKEKPTIVDIHNRERFDRGLNVLFVQFMYGNPEYSQYLKIYNQEITALQTDSKEKSLEVLQATVPDWDKLEADFKAWVEQITQTHVVATRGQWEIDGNKFYKRVSSYKYGEQRLDFNFTPANKPQYQADQLDFPMPIQSPLVNPAKRGVDEPVLGFEIEFNPAQLNQGSVGFALGVQSTDDNIKAKQEDYRLWKGADTSKDQQFIIDIVEGKNILLDGTRLGLKKEVVNLPSNIVNTLASTPDAKLGVNVTIAQNELIVRVKAAQADEFIVNHPIDQQTREQLLNRPFGLRSSGVQHFITPFINDGRGLNPAPLDYSKQAAANVWSFNHDNLALRFARASYKANHQMPNDWKQAFKKINRAASINLNQPEQAQALVKEVQNQLPALAKAGAQLNDALAELSGVQVQLDWLGDSADNLTLHAIITNQDQTDVSGQLQYTVAGNQASEQTIRIKAGQRLELQVPQSLLTKGDKITADFNYRWHDVAVAQQIEQKTQQYQGYRLNTPAIEFDEDKLTINSKLHGPFAGETEGTITFDLHHDKKRQSFDMPFTIEPYQTLDLSHSFDAEKKSLKHNAWVEITVVAESDGESITLRKRSPIHLK